MQDLWLKTTLLVFLFTALVGEIAFSEGLLDEAIRSCQKFTGSLTEGPLKKASSLEQSRKCLDSSNDQVGPFGQIVGDLRVDHQVICTCNLLPGLAKRNLEVKGLRESVLILAREHTEANQKLTPSELALKEPVFQTQIEYLKKKLCPGNFYRRLTRANYEGKPQTITQEIDDLLLRADIFPISMALSISGVESSYCTSARANRKKNPFGLNCRECNFKNWDEAGAYLINNTNCEATGYKDFRAMRRVQRKIEKGGIFLENPIDGEELMGLLKSYNVVNSSYRYKAIEEHMLPNNFKKFDQWLDEKFRADAQKRISK